MLYVSKTKHYLSLDVLGEYPKVGAMGLQSPYLIRERNSLTTPPLSHQTTPLILPANVV